MTTGGSWSGRARSGAPTTPLPIGNGAGTGTRTRRAKRAAGGGPGPRPRRRHKLLRRLARATLVLAVLGALAFGGLLVMTPSATTAPALAQAFDRGHHVVYPGPPVPPRFAAALVSTEDHRFYSEPGIDPFAIARVIWGHLTDHPNQGGATLYQQLAKMLYMPQRSGLLAEAEEATLGIKLDFTFPKAQILQMYADVVYFGHGYYGLVAASCGYFGVTPAGLSWPQAALLAGIVQAPSAEDPLQHLAAARARQAHVLGRLVATATITQAQAARFYRQPLHLIHGGHPACRVSG